MKYFFKKDKKTKACDNNNGKSLYKDLNKNLDTLKDIFEYPTNKGFIIREIFIKALGVKGAVVYLRGSVDKAQVELHVITPLLAENKIQASGDTISTVMNKILQTAEVKKVSLLSDIDRNIVSGDTILFIDGFDEAVSVGTSGFEARGVEKTTIENVIKGPKEGFVESLEKNLSLVRKYVKNKQLITEKIIIGERNPRDVAVMYIKDLADPKLVEKVKKRVSEVQVDGLLDISQLEQHIEERPYSLVPTVLNTERPDRAAGFLMEGHVILFDGSPNCLVVPVTFWAFFHTSEDQYQRWPYANFIRAVRLLSFMIALFTPGIYVAMTTYHTEMIPTDLLLAIAATRELVPFPVFLEVLLMEISFELIREAGARVPTPLGPTISIVGALILGQAAVQAGIVSPILVIIVAITGLASYAIPENSTNYMIRMGRFIYLGLGAFIGFYGIAIFFTASIAYLVSIKSFGIPYLAPKAPHFPSSKDLFFRPAVWKQWLRPFNMNPQDVVRKKKPKGGSPSQ